MDMANALFGRCCGIRKNMIDACGRYGDARMIIGWTVAVSEHLGTEGCIGTLSSLCVF